jgi:hypothetical protein
VEEAKDQFFLLLKLREHCDCSNLLGDFSIEVIVCCRYMVGDHNYVTNWWKYFNGLCNMKSYIETQ